MDAATVRYYSENSAFCVERWEQPDMASGMADHFAAAFAAGSTLLDIGCGSGRDLSQLAALGHDVWGVEPSNELATEAERVHPELDGRIASGHLPNSIELPKHFPQAFDGVSCSAVIMHVPKEQLPAAFYTIRGLLKPGGRVLLSIPNGRPNIVDQRDPANRLFSGVRSSEIELIGERIGLRSIGLWEQKQDMQARAGHSWDVLLLKR